MQWLVLAVWILVVMIALPLLAGVVYGRASLGLQGLAGLGGLVLAILVCSGATLDLAWWAVGCGVLGVLAMLVASVSLTAEHVGPVPARVGLAEEHEAALAGVQLLLFALAAVLTTMVALNIGVAG